MTKTKLGVFLTAAITIMGCVPTDNSKIAFIGNEIDTASRGNYLIDPNGANLERISDYNPEGLAGTVYDTAVSPDRSKVLIATGTDNVLVTNLYVAEADGSNLQLIFNGNSNIGDISWADDSNSFAFFAATANGNIYEEAYLGSLADNSFTQITDDSFTDRETLISPNGKYVAYEKSGDMGAGYQYAIGVYSVETGEETIIDPYVNGQVRSLSGFTWLPDSSRLIYATNKISGYQGAEYGGGNVLSYDPVSQVSTSLLTYEDSWLEYPFADDTGSRVLIGETTDLTADNRTGRRLVLNLNDGSITEVWSNNADPTVPGHTPFDWKGDNIYTLARTGPILGRRPTSEMYVMDATQNRQILIPLPEGLLYGGEGQVVAAGE